jgi:hypothetical protein
MLSEKDGIYGMERWRDYMREADRERLIRQVIAKPARQNHLYCRALIWLGRQLVACGYRLQQHYGNVVEVPTLQLGN